jgi:hypothetical protein
MSIQSMNQAYTKEIERLETLLEQYDAVRVLRESQKISDAQKMFEHDLAMIRSRAVVALRKEFGWTWTMITEETGTSRQRLQDLANRYQEVE